MPKDTDDDCPSRHFKRRDQAEYYTLLEKVCRTSHLLPDLGHRIPGIISCSYTQVAKLKTKAARVAKLSEHGLNEESFTFDGKGNYTEDYALAPRYFKDINMFHSNGQVCGT